MIDFSLQFTVYLSNGLGKSIQTKAADIFLSRDINLLSDKTSNAIVKLHYFLKPD